MNIEQLRERLAVLNGEALNIRKAAEDDKRDLTVEERNKLDGILDSFESIKADIDRLEKLNTQTDILITGQGRKTQPDQPAHLTGDGEGDVQIARLNKNGKVPAEPYRPAPSNWNYQNLGEFAIDVKRASIKGGQLSRKLELSEKLAATIYGNEGSGADGGFAVPPDFRTAIMTAVMGEESLLSLCDQISVSGNNFTCPVDMTTPWQTSGGILTYWGAEAATKTQSKPALQERTTKLNKLYALIPMTDEVLEDASAMDAYLRRKAPEKINFAANLAIVNGSGVGQPLGFLRSPALVAVAEESGQVANTIVANNIFKMYSAMIPSSRSNAVWLINPDVEPMLFKLSIPGTDNTGNAVTGWGGLVYTPANGISASPYATLMGRPVIPTQVMETLGDLGDIAFVDFKQYLLLLKGGANPKVDISMHLWFDQDITAYRFVLRIGGIPWWDTSVSARDGSATYSPFVALADRD